MMTVVVKSGTFATAAVQHLRTLPNNQRGALCHFLALDLIAACPYPDAPAPASAAGTNRHDPVDAFRSRCVCGASSLLRRRRPSVSPLSVSYATHGMIRCLKGEPLARQTALNPDVMILSRGIYPKPLFQLHRSSTPSLRRSISLAIPCSDLEMSGSRV